MQPALFEEGRIHSDQESSALTEPPSGAGIKQRNMPGSNSCQKKKWGRGMKNDRATGLGRLLVRDGSGAEPVGPEKRV